ncbi:TRAP transporter large permease [Pseudohoeflea coraliihabitans]|uniref:TRAP transporter large permease protein n=1 Tax=Pseudohoeflea coraliihabitans TaxID=2860393 RepID=A0ABS6WQR4_9HYPH|nr:TRAP transporter large permease [Pseudohoeflea sp. DP4N28-3]MBW3098314.1 TRAP transporter large permease [Pseudohoeflea sp. DP4N28-3]
MMDALTIGYTCVGLLFLFLALGVPVGVAMGILGVGGMYFGFGENFAFGQLRTLPFAVVSNYAFAVLPLFVLMGVLAEAAGITAQLFYAADLWLRRLRGGLYQAVIVGSALFAAISGSTIVNAVVFTRIAFPEMLRYGYSRSLSIGSIAAAGSFAAMIPPSITMVIYAIITEQSVGKLLIAGFLPGILTAAIYLGGVWVMVTLRPSLAPMITDLPSRREKFRALRGVTPVAALMIIVLGGLYFGFFPPSAAGAVGAGGAFVIALSRRYRDRLGWLGEALRDAASISSIIFIILIGGLVFSRMLVVSGVIDGFVDLVNTFAGSPVLFMIFVSIMYLVLGCFLDTTSMLVVTLPFVFPAVVTLGIDPIWFGIVLVKLIEISVITPPVGINLFAVLGAVSGQAKFSHVVKGVLPFLGLELIVLALLILFPAIATWLPGQMVAG